MKKKDRKRLIAIYVLTAIIFVCLIGAIVAMRRSRSGQGTSTVEATTAQQTVSEDTQEGTADSGDTGDDTAQSVSEMVTTLTPLLGLSDVSTLDAEKIAYYYEVETSDLADCGGVIGDVALADELVIMQAADASGVDTLKAGAQKRLESQKKSFQDYIPEQYKRLEQAQIVTSGNYVMYVCCDDVDSVVEQFQALTK